MQQLQEKQRPIHTLCQQVQVQYVTSQTFNSQQTWIQHVQSLKTRGDQHQLMASGGHTLIRQNLINMSVDDFQHLWVQCELAFRGKR